MRGEERGEEGRRGWVRQERGGMIRRMEKLGEEGDEGR